MVLGFLREDTFVGDLNDKQELYRLGGGGAGELEVVSDGRTNNGLRQR